MNRWVLLACALGRLMIGCSAEGDATEPKVEAIDQAVCPTVGQSAALAFRVFGSEIHCECRDEYKRSGCLGETCESPYDRGSFDSSSSCAETSTTTLEIDSIERVSVSDRFGQSRSDCRTHAGVREGVSDVVDVTVECQNTGEASVAVRVYTGERGFYLLGSLLFTEDGRCPTVNGEAGAPDAASLPSADD